MSLAPNNNVVILCGPPGVFGFAERHCHSCGVTGKHVTQWLGYGYGHDHHCLACRVTDNGGSPQQPTPERVALWDATAATFVLPTELFERYRATELDGFSPAIQTADDEQAWAESMDAVRAEVLAHHDQARGQLAATTEETP